MPEDVVTFRILPDGTVRVTTEKISAANHANADALLKTVNNLLGGDTTVERRGHLHAHAHVHEGQKRDA